MRTKTGSFLRNVCSNRQQCQTRIPRCGHGVSDSKAASPLYRVVPGCGRVFYVPRLRVAAAKREYLSVPDVHDAVENAPLSYRKTSVRIIESRMTLKSLNEQDKIRLRAAEGWFELGNYVLAISELEQITAEARSDHAVLSLRHFICAKKAGRLNLGEGLAAMSPDDLHYWINLAGANQKVRQFAEAKRILIQAHAKFPREYIVQLMLACCCAQLQ
jgi:tetratricopeptide (TPR) repeat protein